MEFTISDIRHSSDVQQGSEVPDRVVAAGRFEARTADGEVIGFAEYTRTGPHVVFPHTVVAPRHRNQGVASRLAQVALDDAREQGLSVVPACSFFVTYLGAHPEYRELLAEPR